MCGVAGAVAQVEPNRFFYSGQNPLTLGLKAVDRLVRQRSVSVAGEYPYLRFVVQFEPVLTRKNVPQIST